jgi:diguanylate cyclase (GGDEF)-like protein
MDSEEPVVLVLETAQNPLALWDDERVLLVFNATTPAVFGYSAEEFRLHPATTHPVDSLMLDLDHFKQVTDEHGHLAGDAGLKNVARALKLVARRDDLVARTDGEEFVCCTKPIVAERRLQQNAF